MTNHHAVTITSTNKNGDTSISSLRHGSLLGVICKTESTRIFANSRTKLVLNSVCLDVASLDILDQVKLLIRFVDGEVAGGDAEWVPVANFLGKERGGQALPSFCALNLEVTGPCSIELKVSGKLSSGNVQVLGIVLEDDSAKMCSEQSVTDKAPCKKYCRGSLLKGLIEGHHFPIMFGILMLLSLIGQGGGGFTKSVPSLNPTQTQKRRLLFADEVKEVSSANDHVTRKLVPSAALTTVKSYASSGFGARALQSDCIDLTLALLPYNLEQYPLKWSIKKSGDTTGDEEIVWKNEYSDKELTNTVILEQSNGENSKEEPICLPAGSYTFGFDEGYDVFVLSSGGKIVSCGEYLENGLNFELPFQLDAPLSSTGTNVSECPREILTCDDGEETCLQNALNPVRCYNGGKEWNGGDRKSLFNDTCAVALNDACQASSFGFLYDDIIPKFCPYFQCANPAYQIFTNGGSLEEYHGCECKYLLI